jgi:translocation and assembly module TamB
MLSKLIKIFSVVLGALILLLLVLGAMTQTRFFKNWLRNQIISAGKESINGEVRLERIDGNLLTRFSFEDVAVIQDADTIVYVPRVDIALHPMALMRRVLQLSKVELYAPRLAVKQREDGSLNLSHLLRPANGQSSKPWAVRLGTFVMSDAQIEYTAIDTAHQITPRRIRLPHAELSGSFVDNRWSMAVNDLRLETFLPGLEVKSLSADISAAGDSMRLNNFALITASSNLTGNIAVHSLKNAEFMIDLNIAPLLLDELQPFVSSLKASGPLRSRVNAARSQGALRVDMELEFGEAAAKFLGTLDEADSTYSVEGVIRKFDFSRTGIDSMKPSSVNARFTAEGRGFGWPRADAHAIVWLDTSRVAGFMLPRLEIDARLDKGRLKTRADYFSELGSAAVNTSIDDFFGEPSYRFLVALKNFDIMKFYAGVMPGEAEHSAKLPVLNTKLSLTCTGSGRSFDPDSLKMSARLDAAASEIGIASIDSLIAHVRVGERTVHIDSLFWRGPTADVHASGEVSFELESNLRFKGTLGDLELIRRLVEADSLRAGGEFSGTMNGPADSLVAQADFALHDVVWNTAGMKLLKGRMDFRSVINGGAVTADASGLMLGDVPLDTATATLQYDPDGMNFQTKFFRGKNTSGEIDGRYAFGDTARLDVSSPNRLDIVRADIFLVGQKWQKSDAPMWIEIGDEVYQLHNVVLQSGEQRMWAEGRLDYLGEEDLQIGMENLNIANVAGFIGRGGELEGIVNASAKFFGSASAPLLQGKFEIRDGRLSEFRFPSAQGSLGYADNRFFWDVELRQNETLSLIGEGFLPMNLALDNHDDVFIRDLPMRLQFNTNGLELSFLRTIFPKLKNLHGLLAFNISAENTLSELQPTGYVYILGAGFEAPTVGIKYRDVQLSAIIDTSFVELQNFKIVSDDGTLAADGRLDFANGTVGNVVASIRADNFLVVHNRDMDMRINADVRVGGTLEQAGFAGDLTVARSRFFLPALQPKNVMQVDEPEKKKTSGDSALVQNDLMDKFLKNSYGELRVLIPRNTWLRGPEMNVEIEGELDLLIHESELLLFGPIKVVRGTYEFASGSKFTIDEGSLVFQGNKDNIPEINFDASRVFRHALTKQKHVLRLKITGRSDAPEIAFLLDDEAIEQTDAFAYLLAGVSFEELTQGQKSALSGQITASGLLTGLVSKQISNALAKNLNLDVIEFQSGEDLELSKSRVLVGKYITNDLFLSYSRDFSSADAQKVSLEYEIAKFLFLQAAKSNEKDTGFDLIWKWEW